MSTKVHSTADKRTQLEDLAGFVRDGDCVAVGGGLSSREPMALLRALIRQGRKGLRVVGSAHGIDIDLLCGGGTVAASGESYVGFEQDFGMAPNYRRACESGAVAIEDSSCATLVAQLRAAIQGVPFMPIRSVRGTGFERLHPEFKRMTCPFTGEELLLVPALAPDVALLHAQFGDARGNVCIDGPPVADLLFARASRKVLVTVERIVSTDELHAKRGTIVPGFYVSALAEVPFGAHPTACYPFYAYDRPHTAAYYAAAQAGPAAFEERYLRPFVRDCASQDAYLEAIGGRALQKRLASWVDGSKSWQELYRAEAAP
jgi:glutaconate CoA-transferase subunit A